MGLPRKINSILTLGVVSYRSPQERLARANEQATRAERAAAEADQRLAGAQAALQRANAALADAERRRAEVQGAASPANESTRKPAENVGAQRGP